MPDTVRSEARPRSGPLPPVVYVLGGIAFVLGTSEFMVAGMLPELAVAFTVDIPTAGLLLTVFAVGMIVGAPALTVATLRLPKGSVVIAAMVLFAVANTIIVCTNIFAVAVAARLLAALATGAFWSVGAVLAATAAGERASARAMGVLFGGLTLALALGVPIGSAGGQLLGWRGPFCTLAGLAILAVLILVRTAPAAYSSTVPSVRDELCALKNPRLWLIYLAAATLQAGVLAVYGYVAPSLIHRAHLQPAWVPLALVGFGVLAIVGTVLGGRCGDDNPLRTMLLGAAAVVAVLCLTIAFGANAAIAVALVALLGFALYLPNGTFVAECLREAGNGRTLAAAFSASAFNSGIAIGTWAGGAAIRTHLEYVGPPVVGTVFALVSLGAVSILAMRRRAVGQGGRLAIGRARRGGGTAE